MKTSRIAILLVSALGLGLVAGQVMADEKEDAAAAEAMAAASKPGPQHAELAKYVGEWKADMTFYVPGMGPMVSEDTESSTMIMNGWFLQSTYSGTNGDPQNLASNWKGRTITGFNTHTQEYESIWFSQMGSAISMHKGKKCPEGIMHLYGSMPHFMTQKMEPSLTKIFPSDEAGTHKMEMHWTDADKKPTTQIMQIIYSKK